MTDQAAVNTDLPLQAWAGLVDALPDATWIVDGCSRRVVADNAAARGLLGVGGASLVGASADALLATPEDLANRSDSHTGVALRPVLERRPGQ